MCQLCYKKKDQGTIKDLSLAFAITIILRMRASVLALLPKE